MKDTRSKLKLYSDAAKRLVMWNFLAKRLSLVLITEFPKSGASWFCQMMSDATGIPFPRNVAPKLQQSIMHGHHLFHPRMSKAIHIMRDGRDVMVSAYYHALFDNDKNHPSLVKRTRNLVGFTDYDNVIENMPTFIRYMFEIYPARSKRHFSWSEMINNATKYKENVCSIKYEELLTNPADCLVEALEFYNLNVPSRNELNKIVEKYSIKNRRTGGGSFVRKGISGDWKNHFNDEACAVFKEYASETLINAGYESDNTWGAHLQ